MNHPRIRHDPPMRTAATVALLLLEREESVPIQQPVSTQFTEEETARALEYFQQRAWVIFSRKRDRVMLSSSVRRQLKDI